MITVVIFLLLLALCIFQIPGVILTCAHIVQDFFLGGGGGGGGG